MFYRKKTVVNLYKCSDVGGDLIIFQHNQTLLYEISSNLCFQTSHDPVDWRLTVLCNPFSQEYFHKSHEDGFSETAKKSSSSSSSSLSQSNHTDSGSGVVSANDSRQYRAPLFVVGRPWPRFVSKC